MDAVSKHHIVHAESHQSVNGAVLANDVSSVTLLTLG